MAHANMHMITILEAYQVCIFSRMFQHFIKSKSIIFHISHHTPFMCTGGMIVMQHFGNVLMSLHLFKKFFVGVGFIASWFLNQLVQ